MSLAPSSTAFPLRVLTATLVGATVLAGCGSGGSDNESDGEGSSTGQPAAAAQSPDAETAEKVEVAPADLANFSCDRLPNGRWKAEGHVTNSADKAMTYTVTVVTTDDREQVVGEQVKSFDLEPDQTKAFTLPRLYRGAAEQCIPHVEREPA